MRSIRHGVCATALGLICLAGCAMPDQFGLNYLQTTSPGGDRVVSGSLESVSQSTQATLRQLGISVVATDEKEAIRLSCTTRTRSRFDLVLTRVQTNQGEQTRVKIEWKDGTDEQFGLQILGHVENQERGRSGAQK